MKVIAAHMLFSDMPYERWHEIMEDFQNLYLDTTNTLSFCKPGARDTLEMQKLIKKYSKRMLFGSDYPMGMAYPVNLLYDLVETICPDQETLDDVSWRTAASLAGLDLDNSK